MGYLIPTGAERVHLRRFYWATFLSEAAHLAMPFQVLLVVRYLGLPQLGVVLLVENLVSLVMEVPTGAWADRYGRKLCVLLGHGFSAIGWFAIPAATLVAHDGSRLAAMCAAFGFLGAGAALHSGAYEAWVVDNLRYQGRKDLAIRFFGRERSLASAGGILADIVALAVVALIDLRLFWIVSGLGEIVSMAVLWRTPEYPATGRHSADSLDDESDDESSDEEDDGADNGDDDDLDEADLEEEFAAPQLTLRQALTQGLAGIVKRPALMALTLTFLWLAVFFGSSAEAFQAALSDARLKERGFAILELIVDILGVVAPLAAVWLADRFSSRLLLVAGIVLSAGIAITLWQQPSIWGVMACYLLVLGVGDIVHTVEDDYQHALMPSATRATSSSAINLLASLAAIASSGLLTWLLIACSPSRAIGVMGLLTLPAVLFLLFRPKAAEKRA